MSELSARVHGLHDLITIREVANIVRVDTTTVRRWIKEGTLKAVVLPHRGNRQAYRIERETLEALLATDSHSA